MLRSFFVRAAQGQYDLVDARQLVRLVVSMARNKAIDRLRSERVGRDGPQVYRAEEVELAGLEADGVQVEKVVEEADFLEYYRSRLTPEERRVFDLRLADKSWQEIAGELGEKPDAVRKRLQRGLDRVTEERLVREEAENREWTRMDANGKPAAEDYSWPDTNPQRKHGEALGSIRVHWRVFAVEDRHGAG